MRIFRFSQETGISITHFHSNFILSRILRTVQPTQIGCMHMEADGIVGFHQATCPQLLLVVNGEGWVRAGSEDKVHVTVGDAVFWEEGEWHETQSDTGLMAIVIEADELNPSEFMP